MKAPTRHQDTNKGRFRLKTGDPPSSILSEAFKVTRYQKYMEGDVRAPSGSGGTWLWTCLLDRVTPPLLFSPSPISRYSFLLPFLLFSTIFLFFIPLHSFLFFQIPLQLFSPSPLSLPPHQSHWSSPIRDIFPMELESGRTGPSRRGSRH